MNQRCAVVLVTEDGKKICDSPLHNANAKERPCQETQNPSGQGDTEVAVGEPNHSLYRSKFECASDPPGPPE